MKLFELPKAERFLPRFFCPKKWYVKKTPCPSRRTTESIPLKFGTHILELLRYSLMKTEPSQEPVPGF